MKQESSIDKFLGIAEGFISKQPQVVVEVGARDCRETLKFREFLPDSVIYTFECNPDTLPLCREATRSFRNIHLIEKAVTNHDGITKFNQIDTERTQTTWPDGNPGASSLFKASGKYRPEKYVQKEIEVKTITLKTFMSENDISTIDLLWMDIQGAELMALQGLGERLRDVKLMHIEVEFFEIYKGQPLFPTVLEYLNKNSFLLYDFTTFSEYAADVIFVNKSILSKTSLLKHVLLNRIRSVQCCLTLKIKSWQLVRLLASCVHVICIISKLLRGDRRTWYLSVYNRLQSLFPKLFVCSSSEVMIDVIIPSAQKDLAILPFTIRSVRDNAKHPINEIIVIAPQSQRIIALCEKENCKYLNEETVLPFTKSSINYVVDGKDRSGWIFQQLLKLSLDEISSTEYFLVIDADTILIRPHTFLCKGKTFFLYSEEYHLPYFQAYHRLLGERAQSPVSFVSHYMLFHKPVLYQLKRNIEEQNNMTWYNAIIGSIDKAEMSGFSEYETYGNFMLSYYPDDIKRLYSFNLSLSRSKVKEIPQLARELGSRYNSISFHDYYP